MGKQAKERNKKGMEGGRDGRRNGRREEGDSNSQGTIET